MADEVQTCEGCQRFQTYGLCPLRLPKLVPPQKCFHFWPYKQPRKSVYLIDILKEQP